MTLQPIVERIKREVPNLLINAWYLDDGTLCGRAEDLMCALKIVEVDGPCRGLKLNRSKSLHFIPENADSSNNPLPTEIPITRSGFFLLGSPIGPANFCESSVSKRVEEIRATVNKLQDLEDSQMETILLRSCLSLPKFNFSLRTCPPTDIQQATLAFDSLIRETLSDLAGGPLSDWAWRKASLPSALGGLNLKPRSHESGSNLDSRDVDRILLLINPDLIPIPFTCAKEVLLLYHNIGHWRRIYMTTCN